MGSRKLILAARAICKTAEANPEMKTSRRAIVSCRRIVSYRDRAALLVVFALKLGAERVRDGNRSRAARPLLARAALGSSDGDGAAQIYRNLLTISRTRLAELRSNNREHASLSNRRAEIISSFGGRVRIVERSSSAEYSRRAAKIEHRADSVFRRRCSRESFLFFSAR